MPEFCKHPVGAARRVAEPMNRVVVGPTRRAEAPMRGVAKRVILAYNGPPNQLISNSLNGQAGLVDRIERWILNGPRNRCF